METIEVRIATLRDAILSACRDRGLEVAFADSNFLFVSGESVPFRIYETVEEWGETESRPSGELMLYCQAISMLGKYVGCQIHEHEVDPAEIAEAIGRYVAREKAWRK